MSNVATNAIIQASILGTIAFNSGKKSIPVLDKELMEMLEIDGIDTIAVLTAWSNAWHAANLSKSI